MAEKAWGVVSEMTAVAVAIPLSLGVGAVNKLRTGHFDDEGILDSAATAAGDFGDRHSQTLTTVAKGIARALRLALPGPTP